MKTAIKYKEIESLSKKLQKDINNTINYERQVFYSVTHHSTAIEGSTLTESQVVNLLEFSKPTATKPYWQHLMVSDYFKALSYIIYFAGTEKSVTPEFIKELGGYVMQGTGGFVKAIMGEFDISKGDFRLCSVRAGNTLFMDYKKVPKSIDGLCKYINDNLKTAKTFRQKMELAFYVHYHFVNIHPFGDGNGRTSRLLMNFVQRKFNLPFTMVFKEDKTKYINALIKTRDTEDLSYFYELMFKQHLKTIQRELKR